MNMKMGIEAALRICFLLFLLSASWQDLKKKTIKKSTFQIWGTVGVILQAAHIFSQIFMGTEKMEMQVIVQEVTGLMFAALLGILLLSLSTATEEAMGKGDGCFFLVAGIFLGFWKNMLLLSGGLFLCFPAAVYLMIKGRKARNTESIPFLPFSVSGGTGGPVFMNKRRGTVLKDERKKRKSIETEWKGSLTVEASCVMAVVLFSLAALIGKAGQIHDETAAAMVLHEGVEKCRHEKSIRSEDAEAFCKRNAGLMLRYTDLSVSIQEKGAKKMGKVKGGDWEKQIEMKEFRPEEFMRMVTGITGGTNEN